MIIPMVRHKITRLLTSRLINFSVLTSNSNFNNKKGYSMNLAIKTLEEIGQNTSIKQHDGLNEMLESLNINECLVEDVTLKTKKFVCLLLPDDEGEGEEE